jgi:hypothetical protein
MPICDGVHRNWDPIANGVLQVGNLPDWCRVRGRVAWYVARGPVSELGPAWAAFHEKVAAARPGRPDGPPGDVLVCDPQDHKADGEKSLLTVLYLPIQ